MYFKMGSNITQQHLSKYGSRLIHAPIFGPQNSLFLKKHEIEGIDMVNLIFFK